jgi:peptidylprolyl isomerase
MSAQLPASAASNTFERIKRVNPAGADFWSARELARVLEYTDFRNFTAVITKAREACANSSHKVADHFVDINEMVSIGSGAQRVRLPGFTRSLLDLGWRIAEAARALRSTAASSGNMMRRLSITLAAALCLLGCNKAPQTNTEMKTTSSGLKYQVLKQGTGSVFPKVTDRVKVHYHGTLLDGTVFDSSVERGQPVSFPLNRVIPGWIEGLQLMRVGDKFKFEIPPNLAYGERSPSPKIPPNSTLVFEVELLGIE